ncbi:OLC1v1026458C1 [Oldenlandia corymbosa var. corymbosa]|uniref:OLC1v1026458C1 n=1 Tax=Oldenlandia corymbosa var. corymbosa TaxID=529605 RepID=A0AAV1C945_OLDCO|nr:OLC1v1026458C1 [Oldenlandia corymbosa var. corymbosa]
MGQGEEVKTRESPSVGILERGEIFFFYRPKVTKKEAHSPADVQRLYVVLRPESGEKSVEEKQGSDSGKEGSKLGESSAEENPTRPRPKSHYEEGGHGVEKVDIEKQPLLRFIVMGKKSLPDPTRQRGRPYWGFVDLVTTKIDDVKASLKGEEYDTKTRGHRQTEPARALGEGIYRILRHNPGKRMHTHLVYKLEFPPEDEKNEAQESLNVEREGSFIIQVKNPDQEGSSGFGGLKRKRRASFPAHLQGNVGHRKFTPADPPDFLNYEGCEFLLIAAADDVEEELGLELKTEVENSHDPSCSDLVRTFGEFAPVKPLIEGTWA